ncbi:hypothetical protein SAY86_009791 [Trapa natans]|uniref:Uncharacterized protein n=1 Tax=Trapa natans TaxID=22666 RepID=A0AAN7QRI0_TRANT|nr:hypothetical protein SAY86_009791 [Trapa natans]
MASASGIGTGRDARRRRIVERGSDRLALITGRIQTLPSPPISSPLDVPSFPPSFTGPDQPHLSDESHLAEDKLSEALLQKLEPNFDGRYSDENNSELPAAKDQTSTETSQLPHTAMDPKSEVISTPMSRSTPHHSSANPHPSNVLMNLLKLVNARQINSAIATSSSARLICSVIGGLLVVLSTIGFPILGSRIIRSILTFRPLYLILLTNMTIIAACLISYKQEDQVQATREENRNRQNDEIGWADHVGNSMELAFLVMKLVDAIIMDCSIYSIIVVFGLSFLQKFV